MLKNLRSEVQFSKERSERLQSNGQRVLVNLPRAKREAKEFECFGCFNVKMFNSTFHLEQRERPKDQVNLSPRAMREA